MRERLPDHHETGTFADRTHDGDARLIAAAPELLAALQSLQSFVAVMIGRGPDAEIPDTIPTPLGVPVKIGDVESAKTAAQADYEARIRSAPTSPASGDEYCPTILHLGVEVGDPHWQFVERDVPTVAGQVFAANVEKLTDFDGNLVGFKIFEPFPASGGRDDDLTTLVQKSIAAFAKLSSEEQEACLKAQRESWARGERGIGSDKVEAEARAAYRAKASGELDAPRCCMCGKIGLSTTEGDGGGECELADGRWVCSQVCYDLATELLALRKRAGEVHLLAASIRDRQPAGNPSRLDAQRILELTRPSEHGAANNAALSTPKEPS